VSLKTGAFFSKIGGFMFPNDIDKWVNFSPQTYPNSNVISIRQNIWGATTEKIYYILERTFLIRYKKSFFTKMRVFLRRSGSEIWGKAFGDGFCTGCADYAVAFLTLARSCHIPCRIIHAFSESWLKTGSIFYIRAHFFVEYFDEENDQWILVDPTKGKVLKSWPKEYVKDEVGEDIWGMGLKSYFDMLRHAWRFRSQWRLKGTQL